MQYFIEIINYSFNDGIFKMCNKIEFQNAIFKFLLKLQFQIN